MDKNNREPYQHSSYNPFDIIKTHNNCYLIGGIQSINGNFSGLIMKVDSNGNELWHNWYYSPNQNNIWGLAEATNNGDIICSGSHLYFGLGDPIIYKVDSNGKITNVAELFQVAVIMVVR